MQVKSRIEISLIPISIGVYEDGSVDVKIPTELLTKLTNTTDTLKANVVLKCPAGLLAYRYLLDYLETNHPSVLLNTYLWYIPNGRQDRQNGNDQVINTFTLQSVAKLLKSSSHVIVQTVDPHSKVSVELIAPSSVMEQAEAFKAVADRFDFETEVVVAPDKGSILKATALSEKLKRPLVIADKIRDPVTNAITGTQIVSGSVKGKRVLIADDICDGGRTFKELAKVLKEEGATHVTLYVTHGLFARYNESLKEHIDEILVYFNWSEEAQADTAFVKTYMNF